MTQADLLALLVHELRSPVAALLAIEQVVRERRHDLARGDLARLLELGVAAARDVERIVIDATPTSLRRETIDPRALVGAVVETAQLRGAPVVVELEPELPRIEADPVRLRQALANVIANALEHSPPGGEVLVRARAAAGELEIEIADEGEGIPLDAQERIFEAGVRLAARPGQGLGLAVARAVAEAHGGTLEVESEPGRGACFRLALPTAASERA
jgi:two-component system sensor histidine kinase KdpD